MRRNDATHGSLTVELDSRIRAGFVASDGEHVGALVPAEVQERITYWWPQALMPTRTQTVLGDKAAVVFPVILLLAVGGVCCVCLCRVCRCFCRCRRNRKGGRDAHDHYSEGTGELL